jgi:hypothetical protein
MINFILYLSKKFYSVELFLQDLFLMFSEQQKRSGRKTLDQRCQEDLILIQNKKKISKIYYQP